MQPISNVLHRLEGLRGDQGEWKARCPAHNDRTPSLSITEASNGTVLLHCFAGCDPHDIVEAIGLDWKDLFGNESGPVRPKARQPKPSRRRERKTPEVPNELWQERAVDLARECHDRLYADEGKKALAYLHERGLSDEIIYYACLGYHPVDRREPPDAWGLPDRERGIWIPRGITVPWQVSLPDDVKLWRLKVRRAGGKPKYAQVPGGGRGLYMESTVDASRPLVLCEGELDALSVMEGARLPAVATGSACGGRLTAWVARIASAPHVLVAFDADEAGDEAAQEWLKLIPHAMRLRPPRHDVNEMLCTGGDVRQWIDDALKSCPACQSNP